MKILTHPDPNLLITCRAVERVTPELQETAREMYKVMKSSGGVGLAANQVGLDIRLIVLDEGGSPLYLFNPHLMQKSNNMICDLEGCMSFPGQFRKIKRPSVVKIKYRDLNNKMKYAEFTGTMARAFLHELDHINGRLYTEYEEEN